MSIKAILDSLEGVEESLHSMYKEADGRYVLDVEGMVSEDDIETHEKTQGLKSALDKERQARKDLEKRSRELENKAGKVTDEDLEELGQLRELKRKAEEEKRRREGEFDKWRDEINNEHKSTLEKRDGVIQSLQSQIREDRIGRQIAEACAEHGAPTQLMQAYIEKHVKSAFDDDGKLQVSVIDNDGTGMIDNEGKPLGISGFVKKLSDSKDFGQYFASTMKNGGGTPPGDRDGQGQGKNPGEKPATSEVDTSNMSASKLAMHKRRLAIDKFRADQDQKDAAADG